MLPPRRCTHGVPLPVRSATDVLQPSNVPFKLRTLSSTGLEQSMVKVEAFLPFLGPAAAFLIPICTIAAYGAPADKWGAAGSRGARRRQPGRAPLGS